MLGEDLLNKLFTVVTLGGGVWAIAVGLRRLILRSSERDWTPVTGRIRSSGFEESGTGVSKAYSIAVEYEYEYRGVQYRGDRVTPMRYWPALRSTAESLVRRYPAGQEVIVFVNPRNPVKAVLEPGRPAYAALCYVLCGAFVAALAYFVLISR
jgi:Protein of unknown function (DUF3592)